jgi:putative transposase
MTAAAKTLAETVGARAACRGLALPEATFYRCKKPKLALVKTATRKPSSLALSASERDEVVALLDSPRFVDKAPAAVYAELLDEGRYLCSVRTMYRLLAARGEVRERRRHVQRPAYAKPELLATAPNQLWSWDITKLHGPSKWTYYYLYVILDVFSRYVVGWMVAHRESKALAVALIEETCMKQGIKPGQLTIHADRGSSMKSKPVAFLLSDLGVTKSHSRPHVSDDNPYSEAQFKTLKYHPSFPGKFGSIEDARSHCRVFFPWYNNEHRHGGIGLMTPYDVHYGFAELKRALRGDVLEAAFAAHPERFRGRMPVPPGLPTAAWINKPCKTSDGPLN